MKLHVLPGRPAAHEAVEAAKDFAKEQPKTSFFAFGVGHFVDKQLVGFLDLLKPPPHFSQQRITSFQQGVQLLMPRQLCR